MRSEQRDVRTGIGRTHGPRYGRGVAGKTVRNRPAVAEHRLDSRIAHSERKGASPRVRAAVDNLPGPPPPVVPARRRDRVRTGQRARVSARSSTPAAERCADIPADGSHIGPRAAINFQFELRRPIPGQCATVDPHEFGFESHILAGSGQFMSSLAVDMHRRKTRGAPAERARGTARGLRAASARKEARSAGVRRPFQCGRPCR